MNRGPAHGQGTPGCSESRKHTADRVTWISAGSKLRPAGDRRALLDVDTLTLSPVPPMRSRPIPGRSDPEARPTHKPMAREQTGLRCGMSSFRASRLVISGRHALRFLHEASFRTDNGGATEHVLRSEGRGRKGLSEGGEHAVLEVVSGIDCGGGNGGGGGHACGSGSARLAL